MKGNKSLAGNPVLGWKIPEKPIFDNPIHHKYRLLSRNATEWWQCVDWWKNNGNLKKIPNFFSAIFLTISQWGFNLIRKLKDTVVCSLWYWLVTKYEKVLFSYICTFDPFDVQWKNFLQPPFIWWLKAWHTHNVHTLYIFLRTF